MTEANDTASSSSRSDTRARATGDQPRLACERLRSSIREYRGWLDEHHLESLARRIDPDAIEV